ncbi:sigma-70 family RNA polymerase sigma factor [Tundrisphaera lichenicola]|uniref:sigma-70 family RNA polymerase sigma factor n=1 Tax=Tundrisphaera lichenicola TaxID=2029860 RepID=UPI003EBF3A6D
MTDSIFRRIAEGDRAAVRECIDRHGGLVWSLARRLSARPSDAEDAVQEIFIELWKVADRYDPDVASESTFVALVARRRLIDRRRKGRRSPDAGPLPEGLAADDPGTCPVEVADEAARASRALGELGEEQRRVLVLSIQQGLSYDQIARSIGQPLGTVKTHARRGLIRLRALLGAPQQVPVRGEDS